LTTATEALGTPVPASVLCELIDLLLQIGESCAQAVPVAVISKMKVASR
jgi:hypothetical protein